jgi:hypothetical protein
MKKDNSGAQVELSSVKEKAKYSTLDVCKYLNLDRERFRAWTLKDFFKPTLEASGKGTRAGFTRTDIYGIALFKLLVERGIKREIVASLIGPMIGVAKGSPISTADYYIYGYSQEDGEDKLFARFIISGETIQLQFSMDSISQQVPSESGVASMPVVNTWHDVHIFNLNQIRKEVDTAIEKLY